MIKNSVELDRVKDHLEKLSCLVLEVNSSMEIFEDFAKCSASEDMWVLNSLPNFFSNVANSLFKNLVIDLCILLDDSEKSDRGIRRFLKRIERQITTGSVKSRNAVDLLSEIQNHNKKINEEEKTIKNIIIMRNKIHAHKDKKYFDDPDLVNKELGISLIYLRKLEEITKSIVEFWYYGLFDIPLEMSLTNSSEFNILIKRLKEWKELNKVKRLEKYDK